MLHRCQFNIFTCTHDEISREQNSEGETHEAWVKPKVRDTRKPAKRMRFAGENTPRGFSEVALVAEASLRRGVRSFDLAIISSAWRAWCCEVKISR